MSHCEEIKYLCRQCDKQFSHMGHLTEHNRVVLEGVKYPCGQCGLQFSEKGSLARHKRAVHEGVKFPAVNVAIKQLQREVFTNTKGLYMME